MKKYALWICWAILCFVAAPSPARASGLSLLGGEIHGAVLATPRLPDPGETGVSKQEQEKLGLQAEAEVYKQMPILPDSSPETKYVARLGKKLAAAIPKADSWPYQFHVVAQKEINAFALPGGPIFVNVGTITAAADESQLAGVMAHEMAHIYMQHSIKQMKSSQTRQTIAGLLGAILGHVGGVAGTLGQLGVGVGSGMLSLRYSRGDEAQADEVGAIIMYKAGYDPVAMAQFFRTLEQKGGSGGPSFLSDHPDPGDRVAAVRQEIRDWPSRRYHTNDRSFAKLQREAAKVKAYTAQQIARGAEQGTWARLNRQSGAIPANLPSTGASASDPNLANVSYAQVRPSSAFTETRNNVFRISYPQNWKIFSAQDESGITIAPPLGVSQGLVAYGVVIRGTQNLEPSSPDAAILQLAGRLEVSNPGLKADGKPRKIQIGDVEGRSLNLTGVSPVRRNSKSLSERDWLVTVPRQQGGLLSLVFIAPEDTFSQIRPAYEKMLQSLRPQ